jgi:outer membrane receptor protein involved in Fe transport
MRSAPLHVRQRPAAVARLLACWLLAGVIGGWTDGARSDPALQAAIAPQPVASALAEFAHQTGLQVVYVSEIARERMSKGAPVGLASADALRQLLDGSGLGFEFLNARTVRIFELAAVAPTAQVTTTEETTRPVERRAPSLISWFHDVTVTGAAPRAHLSFDDDTQTVAMSASAVSGDHLERQGLEQLSDYAPYLPGLEFAGGGFPSQSSVGLRGIGSWNGASVVGYYIDDTPMGPTGPYGLAAGLPLDLVPYDLERLELLRGPQGTLYGAAAEIGLLRYTLKAPSVTDLAARVGADIGTIHGASRPDTALRAMVNVPLAADVLGLRISVYDSYTAGYIDNATTGARNVNAVRRDGGRIATLWSPAESVTVKLNAMWNQFQSASLVGVTAPGVITLPTTDGSSIGAPVGTSSGIVERAYFESPFRKAVDYYSASVSWRPGPIELLSATAWSRTQTHYVEDQTVSSQRPLPDGLGPGLYKGVTDLGLGKFTQELHITSTHGRRIEWIAGAFFSHEMTQYLSKGFAFDYAYHPNAVADPFLPGSALPATYKEWAVFGDVTWRITDRIDLTGGIRRAHDDQKYTAIYYADPLTPTQYQPGHSAERVGTWMSTANYHFTSDVTLHARAATGYQPGFAESPAILGPGSTPFVKPESVRNYEVGLKSTFLSGTARANLTLFHILQHNAQLDSPPGFGLSDLNGENVTAKGGEFETSYEPLPGLKVAYSAAYTQAQATFDSNACCVLDVYQLNNVPKWSMFLTVAHDWSVADSWLAHVGGAVRWVGWEWNSTVSYSPPPSVVLPSYTVLDLNAGLARGRIGLKAFVRNLTDKRAYLSGNVVTDWTGFVAEQVNYVILQPRTVGIGFDYAF